MSREEITAIVNAITELMTALRYATPADKAEIYAGLSLRLTYHPGPGPRTVTASRNRPDMYERVVSEGDRTEKLIHPDR